MAIIAVCLAEVYRSTTTPPDVSGTKAAIIQFNENAGAWLLGMFMGLAVIIMTVVIHVALARSEENRTT